MAQTLKKPESNSTEECLGWMPLQDIKSKKSFTSRNLIFQTTYCFHLTNMKLIFLVKNMLNQDLCSSGLNIS